MHDMDYDSETGDYYYLSSIYTGNLAHVITRMNSTGQFIWDRSYAYSTECLSHRNTLQYSGVNQIVLYTAHTSLASIVKLDSSNGDIVSSHQVSLITRKQDWYHQCRLTNDEQAYF